MASTITMNLAMLHHACGDMIVWCWRVLCSQRPGTLLRSEGSRDNFHASGCTLCQVSMTLVMSSVEPRSWKPTSTVQGVCLSQACSGVMHTSNSLQWSLQSDWQVSARESKLCLAARSFHNCLWSLLISYIPATDHKELADHWHHEGKAYFAAGAIWLMLMQSAINSDDLSLKHHKGH